MKILVVSPTFLPIVGGAEIGVHELYNRIGKKHKVLILTPKLKNEVIIQQGADDEFYNKANYSVVRFSNIFKIPRRLKFLFWGFFLPVSFSSALETFKFVKNFKPDIINFHFFPQNFLTILLLKFFNKIPIVLSLVGREDTLNKETLFFWRFYLKFLLKRVDFIIPNSQFYLGCSQLPNIKIVPYGVDLSRFFPRCSSTTIYEKIGIPKSKIVLFTLQRLAIEKRVDIIIAALKDPILAKHEVVLVIGGKGPEEYRLKSFVNELDLEKKVFFVGYIPEKDLPLFFSDCYTFVFHSTAETFGIVFIQSFASGKPVVSVNNSCIPQIVIEGKDGLLTETFNVSGLAKAINELIVNKKLYDEVSMNVLKKAQSVYGWDTIAKTYEQIFSEILDLR